MTHYMSLLLWHKTYIVLDNQLVYNFCWLEIYLEFLSKYIPTHVSRAGIDQPQGLSVPRTPALPPGARRPLLPLRATSQQLPWARRAEARGLSGPGLPVAQSQPC